MRILGFLARSWLCTTAIVSAPGVLGGQAPAATVHVGVARAEWLSPGEWATSVTLDYRPVRRGALAMVVGAHGLFNQFTPGLGITRRQSVATALLGAEVRVWDGSGIRAHVGSALAASYWWYRYRPVRAISPPGHEFDTVGLLSGLRIESTPKRGPGLSIRADVRTTFTDGILWSPQLGVGIAF